jgi:hypothetical protein
MQTSIIDTFPVSAEWTQWNIDQATIHYRNTLPDLSLIKNYRHGQQAGINSAYKNKKPNNYKDLPLIDKLNWKNQKANKEN